MYPKTLLGPVKYSIINRQVSQPSNPSPEDYKFLTSSSIVENIKKTSSDPQGITNSQFCTSTPTKKLTTNAVKKYNKKRGKRNKNIKNHDELNIQNDEKIKDEINTDIQNESNHENELMPKNEAETDIKAKIQTDIKAKIQTDPKTVNFYTENKDSFNTEQIINPNSADFQIFRTQSAFNPSSNSTSIVNRTVNYLLNKRKMFYGDDHQISRTTSKMVSANLPKTPFEYVRSRPAPILTKYHNYQSNNKLLKSSSKVFACSHSDDEAHDIYETMKSRMKFVRNKNDSNICNDNQSSNITELNFADQIEKNDDSNSDHFEKEKESKSKLKPKPKHFYGENSTSEIMNFLKNRIDWKPQNKNKSENDKVSDDLSNKNHEDANIKDSKKAVSLSLNKETVVHQASEILKKFEKSKSNEFFKENSDDANYNADDFGKGHRKQHYVPPYFRDTQNINKSNESENKTNKTKKKKISNVLDAKQLSQMQDITRQYGIFDEVYRPFAFKAKKKTSSDEIEKMMDFNKFDGFFDINDDDLDSFFS